MKIIWLTLIITTCKIGFMKNLKLLVLLLCIAANTSILSQNSWIVKTPYLGQPFGMIKTSDNYIYLATKYLTNTEGLDSIYIFKYNMQGELIKKRSFHSGYSINMFEASNGNIILSYTQDSNTIIYRISDIEETLEIKEVPLIFHSLIEGNDTYEFLGLKQNNDSIFGITFTNQVSFINKIHKEENMYRRIIKKDAGYFLNDTRDYAYWIEPLSNYYLLDNNLNIKLSSINNLFTNELFCLNNTGYVFHSSRIPLFNDMGMIKLNSNLDSLWGKPFSAYYQYDGYCFEPNDMIATSDGGYAICGTMVWMERNIMYLIKTDAYGNPLIVRDYWNYTPEWATNLVEAPDGSFIMAQCLPDQFETTTFLVRTNVDGSVNANELAQKPNIQVYPNPVADMLNIEFPQPINQPYTIGLYNTNGVLIKTLQKSDPVSTAIDISELPKGIYIITIINSKQTYTRMVLKK